MGVMPDRPYRLRTGDVVEIGVWGEDDMTKRITVGPDGRISYYKATEIRTAGRTLKKLREILQEKLAEDFKNPEVFASLINSAGNFVSITGGVKNPGLYSISNETRLRDLIKRAGGLLPNGESDEGVILRGSNLVDVDFDKLFDKKKAGAREIALNNVLLQPNDRIHIPTAIRLDNMVFVVGAVRVPRAIRYSKSITFLEALVTAGDVPAGAWERKWFIVRGRMNKPAIIPVNARQIRTGKMKDIALQSGDVIFLPKVPLEKTAEVIRQLDVIFGAVNQAGRASNVKIFGRF